MYISYVLEIVCIVRRVCFTDGNVVSGFNVHYSYMIKPHYNRQKSTPLRTKVRRENTCMAYVTIDIPLTIALDQVSAITKATIIL